jgi:hypothetical protein
MTKTDYPKIEIYRHHFFSILASETNLELTAVGESINSTVQPGHKEYDLLVSAGDQRRQELVEQKEAK